MSVLSSILIGLGTFNVLILLFLRRQWKLEDRQADEIRWNINRPGNRQ